MLTTLGRTGSTVSIAYLGAHPEIIAYRTYEVEARYASYRVQLFLSLSDPKSWIYPITADDRPDPGWILGEQLLQPSHFALYPEMFEWFNKEYTESLFKFCFQNLQRHYQQVENILNKKMPLSFVKNFCLILLPIIFLT